MDAARTIMTTRRLYAVGLVLSGLSLLSWVRADGSPEQPCCAQIIAVDSENCSGSDHDEALQRYRCNQSRHWRHVVIGGR
jgi:hypothetical protein